jgi:hypothetical protein
MIRAILIVALVTILFLLSFLGFDTLSEAVQIFIIGIVMFILMFWCFKELTGGPISSKSGPGIYQISNIGGESACMDSFSLAPSQIVAVDASPSQR